MTLDLREGTAGTLATFSGNILPPTVDLARFMATILEAKITLPTNASEEGWIFGGTHIQIQMLRPQRWNFAVLWKQVD